MPQETEIAYLAGLIEGEGGLSITKDSSREIPNYRAYLQVQMADRDIVEWVASIFGGICRKAVLGPRMVKQQWVAYCPAANLETILRAVIPYMKSERRRREAELLIELQRTKKYVNRKIPMLVRKHRESLREEMQRIKGG